VIHPNLSPEFDRNCSLGDILTEWEL